MGYRIILVVGLGMGLFSEAFAATGYSDSSVGLLNTEAPVFMNLVAVPEQAAPNDTVTITFSVSKQLDANPQVLVNSQPATVVEDAKVNEYVYEYEITEEDSLGWALISISGQDTLGNTGGIDDDGILEIVEETFALPVRVWPAGAALLLAVALAALARRKYLFLVCLLATGTLIILPTAFAQVPTVSNVNFTQSPDETLGTKVDIHYELDAQQGTCDITVLLSKDGGINFDYPITSISGDITNVASGTNRHIVWDIAADYPDEGIPEAVIRVIAYDSQGYGSPEMLSVSAGTFEMGRPYEGGNDNEVYVHEVTLDAYQIGKYPVTNQEYADVLNWALAHEYLEITESGLIRAYDKSIAETQTSNVTSQITYNNGEFEVRSREGHDAQMFSMVDHPVVLVSWYGAVAYCNWLSEMYGLQPCYDTATWERYEPVRNGYRLPTEAEWERAAAWDGSKHWRYGVTSDDLDETRANFYDEFYSNPLGLIDRPETSPVGWYNGVNVNPNGDIQTVDSPSPVGAYDMAGSVWEWCHDWHQREYPDAPVTNPTGPPSGSYRVCRGGSWFNEASDSRAARRDSNSPTNRDEKYGFRLSRTP